MIELPKGLVLIADEHCYIVGKPKKDRGKGIEIQSPTYHTSMAQAVQSALDRIMRTKVKDGDITTLRDFLTQQAEVRATLQQMLAPLECGRQAGITRGEVCNPISEGNYISQPSDSEKEDQP